MWNKVFWIYLSYLWKYSTMNHKIAKQLWENCIHKNIGSFTLTQEKQAINDIHKFLFELKHNRGCIHCKNIYTYSDKYDTYYCNDCKYWIENICSDRKCEFCSKRPKYPK